MIYQLINSKHNEYRKIWGKNNQQTREMLSALSLRSYPNINYNVANGDSEYLIIK